MRKYLCFLKCGLQNVVTTKKLLHRTEGSNYEIIITAFAAYTRVELKIET